MEMWEKRHKLLFPTPKHVFVLYAKVITVHHDNMYTQSCVGHHRQAKGTIDTTVTIIILDCV